MTHTTLGVSMSAASIALKMAHDAHRESQQQLVRSMGLLMLAEKELTKAKETAAEIIAKESPEPFHKLGDRYISEKDIQAAISNGIQTATQELIAKLAALDAPKKEKK